MKQTEKHENVTGLDTKAMQTIWEKATVVPNFNPDVYRKDCFGAWIKWDEYERNRVEFSLGWSAVKLPDAVHPEPGLNQGLIPLQWENADIQPTETQHSRVTASGIINIKV